MNHEDSERLVTDKPIGNDSTPLVALVADDHYCKGTITSQGRTASPQYQAFLARARSKQK